MSGLHVQINGRACLSNAMYLETGLIGAGSPLKLVDRCVRVPEGAGRGWEWTMEARRLRRRGVE